jgi:hypothetical protein
LSAAPATQELTLPDRDIITEPGFTALSLVRPGPQLPLDVDLLALNQVLIADLRQLAPCSAVEPLGLRFPLARAVSVVMVGCHREGCDHVAGRGVPQFWITANIPDED